MLKSSVTFGFPLQSCYKEQDLKHMCVLLTITLFLKCMLLSTYLKLFRLVGL